MSNGLSLEIGGSIKPSLYKSQQAKDCNKLQLLVAYKNNLLPLKERFGGEIEIGELTLEESKKAADDERLLPCGIFARWSMK